MTSALTCGQFSPNIEHISVIGTVMKRSPDKYLLDNEMVLKLGEYHFSVEWLNLSCWNLGDKYVYCLNMSLEFLDKPTYMQHVYLYHT